MGGNESVLRYLVAGALTVLALSSGARWRRGGGSVQGTIAGALGLLALVSLLGIAGDLTGYRLRILGDVSLVAFVGSGLLLLEFRHRFVPIPRLVRVAAFAAAVVSAAGAVVAQLPYGTDVTLRGADAIAVLGVIGVWSVFLMEPIVRFWRAARNRTQVQAARLRALAFAYALLVTILVFAAAFRPARSSAGAIGSQVAALVLVLALHAAIAPPRWLRRVWRAPEQQAMRAARDLIMFAPNREILSARAVDWAVRLVGGTSGYISRPDGTMLATTALDEEAARELAGELRPQKDAMFVPLPGSAGGAIVAPIPTDAGVNTLVVLSGPYVQLFGSEEIEILGDYADDVGVAFDRVLLTEELHRLEVARRDFISNAAHELRTPLTAILGFSSMLTASPQSQTREQIVQAVDAIHAQARRMTGLVNKLVDLAQMEQGTLRVEVSPMSLDKVVRGAIEEAAPPPHRALEISVPPVRVMADEERLEQIITALLSNAYTYGGPRVRIEATPNGHGVELAVTDDGSGVPDVVRSHLFEPFARGVEASATSGSGLGLAMARSLAQAFGGDLRYEEGRPGARFVLTLPLAA